MERRESLAMWVQHLLLAGVGQGLRTLQEDKRRDEDASGV